MSTDRCLEVNTVSELLYLESRCRHLRESSFNPRELYLSDIRTILAKPPVIGDAEKYQVIALNEPVFEVGIILAPTRLAVDHGPVGSRSTAFSSIQVDEICRCPFQASSLADYRPRSGYRHCEDAPSIPEVGASGPGWNTF